MGEQRNSRQKRRGRREEIAKKATTQKFIERAGKERESQTNTCTIL